MGAAAAPRGGPCSARCLRRAIMNSEDETTDYRTRRLDLPRFSGHSEKHEKCDKSVSYGKGESAKAEVVFGRVQGRGGEVGKEKWEEHWIGGFRIGVGRNSAAALGASG